MESDLPDKLYILTVAQRLNGLELNDIKRYHEIHKVLSEILSDTTISLNTKKHAIYLVLNEIESTYIDQEYHKLLQMVLTSTEPGNTLQP